MQWSSCKGAGFTTGSPWLGINENHTRINYEAQQNDSGSVLSYYKRMIALRAGSDTLKYGDFQPLHATEKVIVYSRSLGDEKYTVALNFSKKPSKIHVKLGDVTGAVVISNTGRTEMTDTLLPWEAVVLSSYGSKTCGSTSLPFLYTVKCKCGPVLAPVEPTLPITVSVHT
jgi:glycosidase